MAYAGRHAVRLADGVFTPIELAVAPLTNKVPPGWEAAVRSDTTPTLASTGRHPDVNRRSPRPSTS